MKQNQKVTAKKTPAARKKVLDAQEQVDTQNTNTAIIPEDYNLQVASKAYELFERRGFQHGYHLEDWFQAERIIKEGLGV